MKRYTKTIDGKTVIRPRNQIVIKGQRTIKDKDGNDKVIGINTFNPSEEMILADGWMEYVIPEPTEEELLKKAKLQKHKELEIYDKSDNVNEFFINHIPL